MKSLFIRLIDKAKEIPRDILDGGWYELEADYQVLRDGVVTLPSTGGTPGPPGPQGEAGPAGEAGPKGDKGETGEAGPQGNQGEAGATGSQGDAGPVGPAGEDGSQGLPGAQGDQGPVGSQGEQGIKGDTGDAGAQGIQGVKGDTGDAGAAGADGAQGIQGIQGETGSQGPAGPSNYTLNVVTASLSTLTDSATYYFGSLAGLAPQTTAALARMYIPKAGSIKAAYVWTRAGTAGTAENISMNVRLNNATDTLIATVGQAAATRLFSNTALNIAVVQGDYIEIKMVCPAWVTNPATMAVGGVVYIEG